MFSVARRGSLRKAEARIKAETTNSTWNAPPPNIPIANFLTAFKALLKCHFLNDSNSLIKNHKLHITLSLPTCPEFSTHLSPSNIYYILYNLYGSRDIGLFVHWSQVNDAEPATKGDAY